MKGQPNRLEAATRHPFHGAALDRGKPLQFSLDGRLIAGFAGDTVLSAVLAAGIDTVGRRAGAPLALSTRHAPTIAPAALARDPQRALPMGRSPATDGASYVTTANKGGRNPLARLLRRGGRSLELDLDHSDALARPWLGLAGEPGPAVDLVVVGGGVAGLSAALAGAGHGQRVILVEASRQLGGHARLFGTQDGEETPDHAIARLTAAVVASEAIIVMTGAEVFSLRPGVVRLHQVELEDGAPVGRVIDITAPRIVLATGALERLPVFPGNRLPGVAGVLEAYELARLFGVWAGRSALLATSSSPAYRLAMLATDAGIAVPRIVDARPQPQSRFIEFAKAYGITQAAGTATASAMPAPKGHGLAVKLQLAMEGFSRVEPDLAVDRLVVCGGWQPDLTLWHMAGGESSWDDLSASLQPRLGPAGIALAGSAAGWISRSACLASGRGAVDALLGHERTSIEETLIDPIYETPDAPAAIGDEPDAGANPAFLDAGWSYTERPRSRASHWPGWLPFAPGPTGWSLADTAQPLDIADIAAGVQLGAIPAASAGIVAQERSAMVVIARPETDRLAQPSGPVPAFPAFLLGRYAGAALWRVAPDEPRSLDVGALIHADADDTDPLKAVGVVVRSSGDTTIALVAGVEGQRAYVREPGRATAIRLIARDQG